MCDRRFRAHRACAVAIALGVALGIVLMHGLDPRAVAAGHGFVASPAAAKAAVGAAVSTPADGLGAAAHVVDAPLAPLPSMACACIAVIASAALLLLRLVRWGRAHGSGPPTPVVGTAGRLAGRARGRLPPVRPRVTLCVFLC